MLTHLTDGHNDLPINIRKHYKNHIYGSNFTLPFADGTMEGHADLLHLKQGLVGGTFWSVFVPCPKDWDDFSNINYAAGTIYTHFLSIKGFSC